MTIPINKYAPTVGTVKFWRSAAPSFGVRTWRSAMNRFAMQHGKAIAMLANDAALIVEKSGDSLVTHHLSPNQVHWHGGIQ